MLLFDPNKIVFCSKPNTDPNSKFESDRNQTKDQRVFGGRIVKVNQLLSLALLKEIKKKKITSVVQLSVLGSKTVCQCD